MIQSTFTSTTNSDAHHDSKTSSPYMIMSNEFTNFHPVTPNYYNDWKTTWHAYNNNDYTTKLYKKKITDENKLVDNQTHTMEPQPPVTETGDHDQLFFRNHTEHATITGAQAHAHTNTTKKSHVHTNIHHYQKDGKQLSPQDLTQKIDTQRNLPPTDVRDPPPEDPKAATAHTALNDPHNHVEPSQKTNDIPHVTRKEDDTHQNERHDHQEEQRSNVPAQPQMEQKTHTHAKPI